MLYTPDFIKEKINSNQNWLERAIIVLYNKKNHEEK